MNNIKHNFNINLKLAGKDCLSAFMKRNSIISKRKAQFTNPARAQKLNKVIVDDHFAKIIKLYDQLDLKNHPERIYNIDEKGCRLTVYHQQTVLAQKGAKGGKRLHPELNDNLPAGTLAAKSAKGYMANELFKDFLNHLAKYKSPRRCLLIFDGAACHLNLSIVDMRDSLEIDLYCLPSNTTYELQSLDKSVYRSFEHHSDAELFIIFGPKSRQKSKRNAPNASCKAASSRKVPRTIEGHHIQKEAKWSDKDEVLPAKLKNKLNAKYHQLSTSRQAAERTPSKFCNEAHSFSSKNIEDGKKHFYSLVSSSDSSEDKVDEVGETTLDTSFHELLPSPINQTEKAHPIRKKAINYMGTLVTKDLFKESKGSNETINTGKRADSKQVKASWYCHACMEDKIAEYAAMHRMWEMVS
ncbi:unnamed protein product [Acanthoscelides obtectus]|uniref:DDE-1 domain-containing protein n=1 Tax=Acanthoscelides obtectus TaxID=200917 RepID=A0A9P0QBJ7_ACAOB|nr:unnamed protein product [Acanthoscelides obtectus]CAK1662385.1 hypothetical protein AOBTE_LOCUS23119 [Acanthoscelides obtectus]